jgi:hypothetical protein
MHLDNVIIYPNPVKVFEGQREIAFENLPDSAVIEIFTITGRLIRRIEVEPEDSGRKTWNLSNQQGKSVASGIYIYHIKASTKKKTGKIGVIR